MRRARKYDDDDVQNDSKSGYPLMVRLAAIAWIAFGCLVIVLAVAGGVLNIAVTAATPPRAARPLVPPRPGQPIVNAPAVSDTDMRLGIAIGVRISFALVIGGSLIFAGVQTVRGAAKDTLGNSIAVIGLGVLNLGLGGVLIVAGFGLGGLATAVAVIIGALSVAVGLGLVATAVFALTGRTQYLSWRRTQRRRH